MHRNHRDEARAATQALRLPAMRPWAWLLRPWVPVPACRVGRPPDLGVR